MHKKKIKSLKELMTPTWLEHAAFWSGVRRATIAPRSQLTAPLAKQLSIVFFFLFAGPKKISISNNIQQKITLFWWAEGTAVQV